MKLNCKAARDEIKLMTPMCFEVTQTVLDSPRV